jgi:hypothetical protein
MQKFLAGWIIFQLIVVWICYGWAVWRVYHWVEVCNNEESFEPMSRFSYYIIWILVPLLAFNTLDIILNNQCINQGE